MIVVAIIGVLAATAIPQYVRYQYQSKTSEARTNLGAIKTQQHAFRASYDNYANVVTAEGNGTSSTKQGWVETPCNVNCSPTNIADCDTFQCIGFRPQGSVYYRYQSAHRAAADNITAEYCAAGESDLDGDGTSGGFEYQSDDERSGAGIVDCNLTPCAVGLDPGTIEDCRRGFF